MKDKSTKVFLFIPLGMLILGALLFILACFLEKPTSRGTIYTVTVTASLICPVLYVFPGVIFEIIGLIKAAKAKRTGLMMLGIIELLLAVAVIAMIYVLVFIIMPTA